MLRIAVDIDEVLCPMLKHLNKHYKRVYKKKDLPSAHPKQYNFAKHYNISVHESKLLVKSFYDSSECLEMKPLDGSVNEIKRLKQKYKLGVITGRQYYGKDVTYKFLDTYFPDMFDFVICTNSYSLNGKELEKYKACQLMNCDILIDDSLENCKTIKNNDMTPILFGNYSWNSPDCDMNHVYHWKEVRHYI